MSCKEPSIENVSGKAETTDDSESSSNSDTSSNNESSSDQNSDFLDDDEYKIIFNAIVKNRPKNVDDFWKIKEWDLDAKEETAMAGFNFLLKNEENFIEKTLIVALKKGLADVVEIILSLNVDMEVVHYLLDHSPINLAIKIHNLKIVKIILKHNFDVNHETFMGSLPLQVAVVNEDIEIIKEVLKNGANPNVFDDNDKTPLSNALERNRFDIAEILLEFGADVNSSPDWGWGKTALHFAAENGMLETVKFLLKNNANIECMDFYLDTPLELAIENEHVEVLKTLLSNGANANSHHGGYPSPLCYASPKMAKLIFDHAIDLDLEIRDGHGNTVFEHTLKTKKFDILKMIAFHQNMQP